MVELLPAIEVVEIEESIEPLTLREIALTPW